MVDLNNWELLLLATPQILNFFIFLFILWTFSSTDKKRNKRLDLLESSVKILENNAHECNTRANNTRTMFDPPLRVDINDNDL